MDMAKSTAGTPESEAASQKSEGKFAKLFQASHSALCLMTEAEGRFIDVNNAFETLSGFCRETIIGRTSVEVGLISLEEKNRLTSNLDANGEARNLQISLREPSGKPLMLRGDIHRMADGDELCILFIVERITGETEIPDALDESEELFKRIFYFNPTMGIITRKGDGTVIAVNDSFLEVTGFCRKEVLGETTVTLKIWSTPDDRSSFLEQLRQNGITLDGKTFLNKKSGDSFPVSYTTVPVEYRGEQCIFVYGRDITESKKVHEKRKRIETLSRQRRKMEALGTLAGGIAHDFNNILATIVGYTELAKVKFQGSEVLDGYLDQILKSSLRARDLIQRILIYSSTRADRELRPGKISMLVEETVEFLRASIPASIDIRRQISDISDKVLADPAQINQVVVNIVTNAAQSLDENGGILDIRLSNVDYLSAASLPHPDLRPGRHVMLSISDNGHGIAPEAIDRLFDPYFTTRPHGKGAGLGLAVVHGIVKRHKGAITVQSTPAKGATFTVYFPVLRKEEAAESVVEEDLPNGTEKILLVDDEEAIASFLQLTLNDMGYSVTATTSQVEALALFQKDPLGFDLVITDYTMPGLNGADLAKLMRETRPTVPIILTTGFSERMNDKRAGELGFNALVYKPFQRAEIAWIVRKVLDRHKRDEKGGPATRGR